MEGLNYEEAYNELKRENEMLKFLFAKAQRFAEKDVSETDNFGDPLFVNSIAPMSTNLPKCMTLCTPDERQRIIKAVQSRIQDGEWTGYKCKTYGKQVRAVYDTHTARSDDQVATGERKSRKQARNKAGTISKTERERGMVRFPAYHFVLLAGGVYPTETKNCCSHICHNPLCVIFDHLEWSSPDDNMKRERLCNKKKECVCGLIPECRFDLHLPHRPV